MKFLRFYFANIYWLGQELKIITKWIKGELAAADERGIKKGKNKKIKEKEKEMPLKDFSNVKRAKKFILQELGCGEKNRTKEQQMEA